MIRTGARQPRLCLPVVGGAQPVEQGDDLRKEGGYPATDAEKPLRSLRLFSRASTMPSSTSA